MADIGSIRVCLVELTGVEGGRVDKVFLAMRGYRSCVASLIEKCPAMSAECSAVPMASDCLDLDERLDDFIP